MVERVADYPRPPALVSSDATIEIAALGVVICSTSRSLRVLETFHPPTYYLPPDSMRTDLLVPGRGRSFCEWKGIATYWDLMVGDELLQGAIWSYEAPTDCFAELAGWFALYPARMDRCQVNGEDVQPQQGGFYGGWITSDLIGPFKGDPAHPELI